MRNPHAPSRPAGPRSRRMFDPEALIAAGKWSDEQKAKIKLVMEEFKAGTLKSSSGGRVGNKKQALAIALSEARNLTADGRRGRFDERKHRRRRKGDKGGGRFDRKGERDTTVDPEDVLAIADWSNPELSRFARTPAQRRAVGMRAAGTFDESKHPRHGKGDPQGGQFSAKDAVDKADSGGDRLPGDEDDDYQEFKTSGDKIMGWDEDQSTWVQVGNKTDDPDFYEEIEGAEGAAEDDGEVDPYATDYDEAGGDTVQMSPSWNESADQAAADIEDSILESMSHGEGEEGLGDEASQSRGHEDQIGEEISLFRDSGMLEDLTRDYMDDLAQEDPEFDPEKFMNEVEKRVEQKLRGQGGTTASALTAAAAGLAPMVPPKAWFEKPALEGPTPITVTADGQVYGHAALWGTCHTGMSGVCRTPPRSESGYRFFHLGEVDTDDGPVHVGRVTMDTGHAPLTASREGTVRHYDNTGTGAAHVRAYEDEHGIVLAGALLPDLPAEKARRMKGATVSGDWRSIGGKLEMVGMLAVNVPGFPVPRAMAASLVVEDEPHTMALVAAGLYSEADPGSDERKLKALTARALGGIDGLVDAAMGGSKQKRRMGVTAAGRPFDLSKHPKKPKGPGGGQWATKTDRQFSEQQIGDQIHGEIAETREDLEFALVQAERGLVSIEQVRQRYQDWELAMLTKAEDFDMAVAAALRAAGFDPSKHPRHEKGSKRGGQWRALNDPGFPEGSKIATVGNVDVIDTTESFVVWRPVAGGDGKTQAAILDQDGEPTANGAPTSEADKAAVAKIEHLLPMPENTWDPKQAVDDLIEGKVPAKNTWDPKKAVDKLVGR